MRITRLKIENFRSLKQLDIDLGETTVFIGPGVVDGRMDGQVALGRPRRFEALHLAFASSHWLVRDLGSIATQTRTVS